ncbi:hypothetical protein BT96DRAFT_927867 [Gymnopus androsaceus JB14]|uniref:Uncharacterized protein n=1 Tax=Gymnopus androsaceus JB14 TaxID=1447944 RepID=A0A6A4GN92_9AGAR|nr:hypothetical protein BT96DRAFT_927867 [Gymnopus androsaceus JB14]
MPKLTFNGIFKGGNGGTGYTFSTGGNGGSFASGNKGPSDLKYTGNIETGKGGDGSQSWCRGGQGGDGGDVATNNVGTENDKIEQEVKTNGQKITTGDGGDGKGGRGGKGASFASKNTTF